MIPASEVHRVAGSELATLSKALYVQWTQRNENDLESAARDAINAAEVFFQVFQEVHLAARPGVTSAQARTQK